MHPKMTKKKLKVYKIVGLFWQFDTLELSSGWGRGQPPVFPAPKMSCSKKYMSNGTLVGQNGKEEYYQYFNKYAIIYYESSTIILVSVKL